MKTTTKERPIMFKPEMVRAILEGRKTQTRRPIKRGQVFRFCRNGEGPCDLSAAERRAINAEPFHWEQGNPAHPSMSDLLTCCPFGVLGDRLWVRETWQRGECFEVTESPHNHHPSSGAIYYKATEDERRKFVGRPWRSSMMMPRVASRLTLEIVSVRVERVNEITDLGAQCEGVRSPLRMCGAHRAEFARLWDTLYAKTPKAWAANPWVWVVEFKRVES